MGDLLPPTPTATLTRLRTALQHHGAAVCGGRRSTLSAADASRVAVSCTELEDQVQALARCLAQQEALTGVPANDILARGAAARRQPDRAISGGSAGETLTGRTATKVVPHQRLEGEEAGLRRHPSNKDPAAPASQDQEQQQNADAGLQQLQPVGSFTARQQQLDQLAALLESGTGGILEDNVAAYLGLMGTARLLTVRRRHLAALLSTAPSVLQQLDGAQLAEHLAVWLADGEEEGHATFLLELMQALNNLVIDPAYSRSLLAAVERLSRKRGHWPAVAAAAEVAHAHLAADRGGVKHNNGAAKVAQAAKTKQSVAAAHKGTKRNAAAASVKAALGIITQTKGKDRAAATSAVTDAKDSPRKQKRNRSAPDASGAAAVAAPGRDGKPGAVQLLEFPLDAGTQPLQTRRSVPVSHHEERPLSTDVILKRRKIAQRLGQGTRAPNSPKTAAGAGVATDPSAAQPPGVTSQEQPRKQQMLAPSKVDAGPHPPMAPRETGSAAQQQQGQQPQQQQQQQQQQPEEEAPVPSPSVLRRFSVNPLPLPPSATGPGAMAVWGGPGSSLLATVSRFNAAMVRWQQQQARGAAEDAKRQAAAERKLAAGQVVPRVAWKAPLAVPPSLLEPRYAPNPATGEIVLVVQGVAAAEESMVNAARTAEAAAVAGRPPPNLPPFSTATKSLPWEPKEEAGDAAAGLWLSGVRLPNHLPVAPTANDLTRLCATRRKHPPSREQLSHLAQHTLQLARWLQELPKVMQGARDDRPPPPPPPPPLQQQHHQQQQHQQQQPMITGSQWLPSGGPLALQPPNRQPQQQQQWRGQVAPPPPTEFHPQQQHFSVQHQNNLAAPYHPPPQQHQSHPGAQGGGPLFLPPNPFRAP